MKVEWGGWITPLKTLEAEKNIQSCTCKFAQGKNDHDAFWPRWFETGKSLKNLVQKLGKGLHVLQKWVCEREWFYRPAFMLLFSAHEERVGSLTLIIIEVMVLRAPPHSFTFASPEIWVNYFFCVTLPLLLLLFSTQSSDCKNDIVCKAWFLFWNLAMLTESLWMKFYNDEFDQMRNTSKA